MGCVASSENAAREERRRRRREKKNNNGRSSRHDETPTRYERRGDDDDSDAGDARGRAFKHGKTEEKGSKSRGNKAIPDPAESDGEESRRAASNRNVSKKKSKQEKKQQTSSVDPLYTVSSAAARKSCLKRPNKTPPSAERARNPTSTRGSRRPATPSTMRSSGVNTPAHADSPYTHPIESCATLPLPGTTIVVGDAPPLPVPGLAALEEKRRSPKAATPHMQRNAPPHGTPHGLGGHRRHHRRDRDVCAVHTPEDDGGRSHHDSAHSLSTGCLTEAALAMHVATTSQGTTLSNGRAVSTPHADGKKTKRAGIMRWIADCCIDGSDPSPRVVECATGFGGTALWSLAKGSAQATEMELYEDLSRAGSVSSSGTRRSFLE
uniref:Uncharacterized protein n=1 Tax=Neobodo designis TaxID=312471 RepID=A0A7S1QLT5_NEODS